MTQSSQTPPVVPTPDELVARYLAAQAQVDADASSAKQPSPAVRANVLAYAQQLADSRTQGAHSQNAPTTDATPPADVTAINSIAAPAMNTWTIGTFDKKNQASNDNQWKIRALASVAVFGLSSLLFFQWQNGSQDEQDAAFSMQRPAPAAAPAPAPAPAAAPAADAAPLAPTALPTPVPATAPFVVVTPASANAKTKATQAAADAAATAPEPARESAAQSSGQDKESAKASALAVPPSADRVEKSSSAKLRRESAAEVAAAPQMEISQAAAAPAAAAAPSPAAPSQPANTAPALARGRMAAPDTKAAQSRDSSDSNAQRGQPSGNYAAKDTATGPAGAASTVDNFAAGAAAAKPLPGASPVSPLIAAATANSALFNAIRSKNRSALQTALASGADKNAKDNGTPAITLCVQAGQTELVRLLAAAGADVNALDAQGISALDHARGRDLQDIVALLVQYGAK
jgi:hypothetical protein